MGRQPEVVAISRPLSKSTQMLSILLVEFGNAELGTNTLALPFESIRQIFVPSATNSCC